MINLSIILQRLGQPALKNNYRHQFIKSYCMFTAGKELAMNK